MYNFYKYFSMAIIRDLMPLMVREIKLYFNLLALISACKM